MNKKIFTTFMSVAMAFTMMPTMAFASEPAANSIHDWTAADWTTGGMYGSVVQDAETNAFIIKGSTGAVFEAPNVSGPYSKKDTSNLANGPIETELNVYIDPAKMLSEAADHGDFTVTTSLDKAESKEYLTEMTVDFRRNGSNKIEVSVGGAGKIGEISEAGVYTIHWKYTGVNQGEGFILKGEVSLLLNGRTACKSSNVELKDFSDGSFERKDIATRSVWFVNVDVENGLRVFTDIPVTKAMQTPHKYEASDWVLGSYGDVIVNEDNNTYQLMPGEDSADGGYMVGPYSKKGNQKFNDGNLSQEINILVNTDIDEESYVNNGVKFALACALNDKDGNYCDEISYDLQKVEGGVQVIGTNIVLNKSDVYTFRFENTRDNAGNVTGKLVVLLRGAKVGETEAVQMNNNCSGHRYLWINHINLKGGIKVYKEVPPSGVSINDAAIRILTGSAATLFATVIPATSRVNTITWSSSDETVVKVVDGQLEAVGAGEAIVTAKTSNGRTDTCTVTVVDAPKKGDKITSGNNTYVVKSFKKSVYLAKAKNATSATVPATITVDGVKYDVTGISSKAFSKTSKVKTVYVKTKKLTKASVKNSIKGSKVKTIKLKMSTKKLNKSYVTKYKKIFTKKNCGKTVKVTY